MNKPPKISENQTFLTNLSIMLVEDSKDDYVITSRLLAQIFGADKIKLTWEQTYEGALIAVQKDSFDALLVDVNLSHQNGLILIEDLNLKNIEVPPVIILTDGDSIELELKAIRLGASDCIFKNQLTAPLLERVINFSIVRKQTDKELRYRAILETANDGIITLGEEGRINSYNPAAERIFGYTAEEMIGKNIVELMPKRIGVNHDGYLSRYLNDGVGKIIGSGREVCGLRKDGTEFPLYLSIADVGVSGKHRFSGIIRDLTLEKKAEETIKRHNETLENTVRKRTIELVAAKNKAVKADNAKSEFLANISHEIRTPLYGILSFANMGADRALSLPPKKLVEYFQHIKKSGDRLLILLNDLLDLSKLEVNKSSMTFNNEDIEVITQQCFQSEKARLKEKQIHWKITTDDVPTKLQCNYTGIRQVISNMLSNAIRFTPNGGVIEARITASKINNYSHQSLIDALRFVITDEGVGIPENETEIIFDKFVQSSKTNTGAGGTGLGLSICKEIIDIHRGNIWAENRSETGASFIFNIPITQNSRQQLAE